MKFQIERTLAEIRLTDKAMQQQNDLNDEISLVFQNFSKFQFPVGFARPLCHSKNRNTFRYIFPGVN